MTVRDGFEGCLEVGQGLDPVNFRRGDERSNAPPGAAAFVVACKKCVLSRQGNWADQVLYGIGANLDAAVAEEGLQPFPLTMDVRQLLVEARL